MSHTLHRRGNEENLKEDFIVFAMSAKGINDKNSKDKLQHFLRIMHRHHPVNMGDMKTGNLFSAGAENIIANVQDTSIVHAVFTSKEEVAKVIKEVKEADLGISVIVSGIMADVHQICGQVGIKPHTVEHSLGIMGKLSRLPEDELLQITTMCGHGMVSSRLARKMLLEVKRGRLQVEEAAQKLAYPCVCGVFNPARAAKILSQLADLWCIDEF
ncbi:hypothetical protein MHOCP_16820 [Moorella humiferrea]|uniref:hypothetical protein n=1 Tax=Neomoorella humiferrea TaxID=676965 RepID=UPI0030CAD51A